MSNLSRNDYVTSIEESAATISKEQGYEIVQSIYQRYGANCIEDPKTSDLPEVFSELHAIEADLK